MIKRLLALYGMISLLSMQFIRAQNTPLANVVIASTDLLRADNGVDATPIYLAEKGKEGFFYLDKSDTKTSDDEGTTIVTKKGLRYKRMFEGEVSVTWFGAKGDGKTNDSEAFRKAIAASTNSVYVPYSPAGYKIANVIVSRTVTIRGDNKLSSIIIPAANGASCFITANQFVEYRDLYFEGRGSENATGVEHQYRIATVSNCFFSQLYRGIYNNKKATEGKTDEETTSFCRFRNCNYGVYSEGNFINSKILNSTFHGCTASAIYCSDESVFASTTTTEGLVIDNCLIYSSGNGATGAAAIELINVEYSYISNCMLDFNQGTAFRMTNTQFCRISNTYFSTFNSKVPSTSVQVIGNCSNSTFRDCQFFSSTKWGVEVLPLQGRATNKIWFNGCSANNNAGGDLFVSGSSNVWVVNCNFFTATSKSIALAGKSSIILRSSYFGGEVQKESANDLVDMRDCPGKPDR